MLSLSVRYAWLLCMRVCLCACERIVEHISAVAVAVSSEIKCKVWLCIANVLCLIWYCCCFMCWRLSLLSYGNNLYFVFLKYKIFPTTWNFCTLFYWCSFRCLFPFQIYTISCFKRYASNFVVIYDYMYHFISPNNFHKHAHVYAHSNKTIIYK